MRSSPQVDRLVHPAQIRAIPEPGRPKHAGLLGKPGRINDREFAVRDGRVVAVWKSADRLFLDIPTIGICAPAFEPACCSDEGRGRDQLIRLVL